MPNRVPIWYVNQLSQDYYGTDVPTLRAKVERLERQLRARGEQLLRQDVELSDLRRRYNKLHLDYDTVHGAYQRAAEMLREERRRWRRHH